MPRQPLSPRAAWPAGRFKENIIGNYDNVSAVLDTGPPGHRGRNSPLPPSDPPLIPFDTP